MKRKWKSVNKNPEKALKDQGSNIQLFNLVNNLPDEKVNGVITEKVLEMDKNACSQLLDRYLSERVKEDEVKQLR